MRKKVIIASSNRVILEDLNIICEDIDTIELLDSIDDENNLINNPFLHEAETLVIAKGFNNLCELDCVKKIKLKNKKIKTIIMKDNVLENYYEKAKSIGVDEILPLELSRENFKELFLKTIEQSSLCEIVKNKNSKCLSPREEEVFNLMMEGVKSKEIAKKLFIDKKTVEFHRANIRKKLGNNIKDYMNYLNKKN